LDKIKQVAVLGSTGSIGTQTLQVIAANSHLFAVHVLTAMNQAELLISQAKQFLPKQVVICNEALYSTVKEGLAKLPIEVLAGEAALAEVVTAPEIDIVLTALVGSVGLKPTVAAINSGKDIALANKETLVVAGELVMNLAKAKGVKILPVDSEHSAIFQCLVGEDYTQIEKVILTASGGPFRGKTRAELAHVTKAQALKHPNWVMGAKITIDSASLMNKGLEVIEAKWLFQVRTEQIEVVVHPQSIIHSLVQFTDGSMKAQMGLPDMKLPIHYALAYPNRLASDFERFDFLKYPNLSFQAPDTETFRNLQLAFKALHLGGNSAAVLNAANEIAVAAFLEDKIGFLAMSDLLEQCMETVTHIKNPSLEALIATDAETRELAKSKIFKQ
jgi:1-deoxy-D-xylulose-5-phosphate reductoisomerase